MIHCAGEYRTRLVIKVAWFASGFLGRAASGTAQTAKKIISYLIAEKGSEIEITLLLKNVEELNLLKNDILFSHCKFELLPSVKGRFLKSSRQYYKYCRQNKKAKYDIVHFSVPRLYPFFWKFPATKFVCTFHAGGEISVPTDAFIYSQHIYNFLMKRQWRKLDAIYADSDFGLNEINRYYKIPKKFITKIYLGADDLWNVQTSKISDFNERTSTALIIGRWQIYKNLHTVLDAIYQSNDEIIKNLHLIVLGKSDKLGKNLVLESVKQFEAHLGRLRLIEYLEEPHLKYLYNKVDLVIHPSINEGFGIPAFEAFGEGAKIVVHRGTPADEYLSMYPGVFAENLLEHKKIENAILQALKSKKVNKKIRRKIIKNYGMTWENLALKTLKSYEQVKSNK